MLAYLLSFILIYILIGVLVLVVGSYIAKDSLTVRETLGYSFVWPLVLFGVIVESLENIGEWKIWHWKGWDKEIVKRRK